MFARQAYVSGLKAKLVHQNVLHREWGGVPHSHRLSNSELPCVRHQYLARVDERTPVLDNKILDFRHNQLTLSALTRIRFISAGLLPASSKNEGLCLPGNHDTVRWGMEVSFGEITHFIERKIIQAETSADVFIRAFLNLSQLAASR